jgi:dienelactone hydrolase
VHDFTGESPVDDRAFAGFKLQYESRHLDQAPHATVRSYGRQESIEINTAYGQERFTLHLALPRDAKPPYQTVVVFPTAAGLYQRSVAGSFTFDYLIRSGRAVAYPVYKSTFERHDDLGSEFPNQTAAYRDHVMMWSKDVQTTVDYLETRADIAHDKMAYLGLGWGAAMGPIVTATEPRFGVAIFQNGGFYAQRSLPEADAVNFAPRVRIPTLMLNGQYDRFFPVDRSQRFLFNLLGVRDADKRWVLYPTDQGLPRQKMIADTVGWIDRYFGRVAVR